MPLTNQERSGTPQETRGATGQAGASIESLFTGEGGAPVNFEEFIRRLGAMTGRMGAESTTGILGINPLDLDLNRVAGDLLADPGDQTSDFFRSLEPFEARERADAVAQLRENQGMLGGRFGTNAMENERRLQGELTDRFTRTRQQGLLEARDRQIQALDVLTRGILGARGQGSAEVQQMLNTILGFIRPGEPVIEQGALPGLIGTAGTVGGLFATRE